MQILPAKPYKGINYDTGFEPFGPAHSSRRKFDPVTIRREMEIIAGNLHCTHVRITGADPHRLGIAARHAIEAGLRVWFSPFPCNLTIDELEQYLTHCAGKAEEIRLLSPETVFVLGCELSLFNNGFLPGNHLLERSQAFTAFDQWQPAMDQKLNHLYSKMVPVIRQQFKGEITYAAGEWEDIDWSIFDIVSVDLYRAKHNLHRYKEQLETYTAQNLDMASYGLVQMLGHPGKQYPDMSWEPRKAFWALSRV